MSEKTGLIRYLWFSYRPQTLGVGSLVLLGALAQVFCLIILAVTANDILAGTGSGSDFLPRLFLFLVSFLLATGIKVYSLRLWTRLTEQVGTDMVLSTSGRLAASTLRQIELLGEAEILSRLAGDVKTLGAGLWSLLAAAQTLTMLIGALAGLALFAFDESLMISLATVVNFIVIFALNERAGPYADASVEADERFQQRIRDLILGFKDLRMDAAKEYRFFHRSILPASRGFRRLRIMYSHALTAQILFFVFYLMGTIGFVIFVGPRIGYEANIFIIIAVYFYLLDRMELLSAQIPLVNLGQMALERLQHLRHVLPTEEEESLPEISHFKTLAFRDVICRYRDQDGQVVFTLGPVSLDFESGKIYLIQGGNGSGKSSLMKVLTGLYVPDEGQVLLDGHVVAPGVLQSLFVAVFTDFHLFESLYGIDTLDDVQADYLLRKLQMEHKVEIRNGAFSTTDLSTGQRKRLALIAACLEKRSVFVLDEWTADQDPEFRRFFFTELLPWLRAEGHTIFAVTHDDQYFGYGDQAVRLEGGQVVAVTPLGGPPPASASEETAQP